MKLCKCICGECVPLKYINERSGTSELPCKDSKEDLHDWRKNSNNSLETTFVCAKCWYRLVRSISGNLEHPIINEQLLPPRSEKEWGKSQSPCEHEISYGYLKAHFPAKDNNDMDDDLPMCFCFKCGLVTCKNPNELTK